VSVSSSDTHEIEARGSPAQRVRHITDPPFDTVGAMALDDFLSINERY
jgi:hypothetical protein